MSYRRSVPRLLHDEHLETIALLDRIDRIILSRRDAPPAGDPDVDKTIRHMTSSMSATVPNHFGFEEETLFPFLAERGDVDIGVFLEEEHNLMRDVAAEIIAAAGGASANGFDAKSWMEFRRLSAEWVERMMSHVQKEEMALLPILEDALDADSDSQLVARYTESQ